MEPTHPCAEVPDLMAGSEYAHSKIRIPRIAIVGAGLVGTTTAYALLLSGIPAEIVLIGRDSRRTEGHVHDLRDAGGFSHECDIRVGELSDCRDAEITVITAGISQAGSKSREEGLEETGAIVRILVSGICRYSPNGILLIASNPVDVMTYAAWKWSGLPAARVIGSGTSLDTVRLRRRIAERYGVASSNVHAYVVGEHGETQLAALSSARVGGFALEEFHARLGSSDEEDALSRVAKETRSAGSEIIRAKGATHFGIGAALVRIIRAILKNERSIQTVSSTVPEEFGLGHLALSLPSIIDRHGIDRVLPILLNETERKALEVSAGAIKRNIARLARAIPF